MQNYIEIVSIPVFVTAIYWVINLLKTTEVIKEKHYKIIPLIAATLGVLCGIIAYFAAPEIIPADNIFMALLIGGASELASTGTNQIFKQLLPKDEDTNSKEDSKDE